MRNMNTAKVRLIVLLGVSGNNTVTGLKEGFASPDFQGAAKARDYPNCGAGDISCQRLPLPTYLVHGYVGDNSKI